MANKNLQRAKDQKNDEFFTQLSDIEKELIHYKDHFKSKVVFCNCDDPEYSNFWKHFMLNFDDYGLKKLIATHYEEEGSSYKLEYDGVKTVKTPLEGNGDFRSQECIDILKEADRIITNPPFSHLRAFFSQLMEYDKKFLIIGSQNIVTYKDIFKLLKEDKIWLGKNSGSFKFEVPEDYNTGKIIIKDGKRYVTLGNIAWYTNLDIPNRYEDIPLKEHYIPEEYPKYDNFDAIEVSRIASIPCDYYEPMGVPITFLNKHNPHQFEILGNLGSYAPDGYSLIGAIYIDGRKIFKRILIKRKM